MKNENEQGNQCQQPEQEDVLPYKKGRQLKEPPKCHMGYWVE